MKDRILKIKNKFIEQHPEKKYSKNLYYLLCDDRTLHNDREVWDRVYKSAKIIDSGFMNFRYFTYDKAIKTLEFAEKYDILISLV